MPERIPPQEVLVEFSKEDEAALRALFESATEKMEIIERLELEVRKDTALDAVSEFDTVLTDANNQYYALESLLKKLPPAGQYIESAEHTKIKQDAVACEESVGVALSLLKGRLEDLGYELDITISEEVLPEDVSSEEAVAAESVPETVDAGSLLNLYLMADLAALKVPGDEGLFKDKKTVVADIEAVLKERGLTLDDRENEFLGQIKNILTQIQDTEKSLWSHGLTDESVAVLSASLNKQRRVLLSEVAAFLQVEKREETLHEDSGHLPEGSQQDIETNIQTNLATFEVYQTLPKDSPFRDTSEFKAATNGNRAVKNFVVRADDPVTSQMVFNEIVAPAFIKQMNALRSKAEDFGGIDKLLADKVDENSLPKALTAEATETLDSKLTAAVADYTEFFRSLPVEFLDESRTIGELDTLVDKLLSVRDEKDSVLKAGYVATFVLAVTQIQAEYQAWKDTEQVSTKGEVIPEGSFDDANTEVELPESINPYDLSALEDVVPSPKSEALSEADSVRDYPLFEMVPTVARAEATPVNDSVLEDKYPLLRTSSLEAKSIYKDKEAKLNEALQEYFAGQNFLSRLSSSKKVLGINAELPPALEALRQEYRAARAVYAGALDAALAQRAKEQYQVDESFNVVSNKAYDSESEKTRAAFARRFILKPQEQQLAMQEQTLVSDVHRERLVSILKMVSKHKWLVRTGMVAGAGIAGALSGGVGLALTGASFKAASIAAASFAGMGGAKFGKAAFAADVKVAEKQKNYAKSEALNKFSLDSLIKAGAGEVGKTEAVEAAAEAYGRSIIGAEKAKRNQKIATVAGAVIGGGVAGASVGLVETVGQEVADSASLTTESLTPAADVALPSEKVSLAVENEAALATEVINAVVIPEIKIPVHSFDGTLLSNNTFTNISFGDTSNAEAIPIANQAALVKYVTLKATDLLEANPTMPEARIEAEIFKGVSQKFGQEAWWRGANITKVDIGEIKVEQTNGVTVIDGDADAGATVKYADSAYTEADVVTNEQATESVINQAAPTKSGVVTVVADASERAVPIKVATNYVPDTAKVVATSGRVYTEQLPVAEPIPPSVDQALPTPPAQYIVLEAPSVKPINGSYIDTPSYQKFTEQVFGSTERFENAVGKAVQRFDKATYDFTDTLFGSVYESPYTFLQDLSVAEVAEFRAMPNDEVRYFLQQNNIKYETYLAWIDKIDELQANMPHDPKTTIGDLYGRAVAEGAALRLKALNVQT